MNSVNVGFNANIFVVDGDGHIDIMHPEQLIGREEQYSCVTLNRKTLDFQLQTIGKITKVDDKPAFMVKSNKFKPFYYIGAEQDLVSYNILKSSKGQDVMEDSSKSCLSDQRTKKVGLIKFNNLLNVFNSTRIDESDINYDTIDIGRRISNYIITRIKSDRLENKLSKVYALNGVVIDSLPILYV
jgi:hypothetical protein